MRVRVKENVSNRSYENWNHSLSEEDLARRVLRDFGIDDRYCPDCVPCHVKEPHLYLREDVSRKVVSEICVELGLLLCEQLQKEPAVNDKGQSNKTNSDSNCLVFCDFHALKEIVGQKNEYLARNHQGVEYSKRQVKLHYGNDESVKSNDYVSDDQGSFVGSVEKHEGWAV